MSYDYAVFESHNPIRALDWRWQRAGYLAGRRRRRSRETDDAETIRAAEFRRSLARCTSDLERLDLIARMPQVAGAHAKRRERETRHSVKQRSR
ncbi:MAG: hypothetical protein ABIK89_22400 [Planctomycetota bacterium]